MKLKELREKLKDVPDDYTVIVQASDAYVERCWQKGIADEVTVFKKDKEVWISGKDEQE